jgi:hypothetical protein
MFHNTAILGSDEFVCQICLAAKPGSLISTGREDSACCSAVLLTLSEGLEIKVSDSKVENVTLKGYYLCQEVEIGV